MAIIVLRRLESAGEVESKLLGLDVEFRRLTVCNRHIIVAWPDDRLKGVSFGDAVELVLFTKTPYSLVSKEFVERLEFKLGRVTVGSDEIIVIAGPCAVESEDQMLEIAEGVKRAGAHALRGGAFKPRTSPYTFQGLGELGLKYLRKASETTGLPVVTEVMDTRDVGLVARYADAFQIGARNAQNFALLREVGKVGKPVLLKRGFGMTVDEILLAAEYVVLEGTDKVAIVERGIRTFERSTRFTLDIAAVPVIKMRSSLPVVVDPSHAAGRRDLVEPLALAAIAAGADGLMIEVHNDPDRALSDREQQLTIKQFSDLMVKIRRVAEAVGRRVP